ncbi:MAG: acetyl-CoA carboxylase biotin carboxylase subunit [Planctomycetota bacterium]
MFNKILIANRGEIAVRIARTLQPMGICAVAVYSDADRAAVHVGSSDEAYPLEGNSAADTYLRGDKIIDIAKRCGADAIHPGYGFLAENPTFAQACKDAGFVFIGPKPEVMRRTGNKVEAKRTLSAAGVPVVPGWSGGSNEPAARFANEAKRIGFPVLIKAAAGGGGKGMRVVEREAELIPSIEAARREAAAAFGDGQVFLEKYVARPRHVEFQIFGDEHGNVVHLFERECSLQRRHQKIIEEAPSPALTPELRQRMGEAALRVARAVGYTNAGTVEFLVDASSEFYFLEVNTRLQVEHPITEMTLQQDLVRTQVLVADGQRLPFSQEELRPRGHAIECRICAEDADRNFMPATGTIERYVPPMGPNVRVDSGVAEGSQVSVYYDSMLAKLICWGQTREEAIAQTIWALDRLVILGLKTNIAYLRSLLTDAAVLRGEMHTQYVAQRSASTIAGASGDSARVGDDVLMAAAVAMKDGAGRSGVAPRSGEKATRDSGPWRAASAWRNT